MQLKRLMLATSLAALCATAATGALAWHDGQKPSPEQRAEHMQKALQLNAEQQKKVLQILQQSDQQRAALEKKYTIAERDKFREEAHKLRDTQHSQIDAVLTPAQREAMAAQRHHMRHGKGHMGMGGPKGDCPPAPQPQTN